MLVHRFWRLSNVPRGFFKPFSKWLYFFTPSHSLTLLCIIETLEALQLGLVCIFKIPLRIKRWDLFLGFLLTPKKEFSSHKLNYPNNKIQFSSKVVLSQLVKLKFITKLGFGSLQVIIIKRCKYLLVEWN